MTEAKLANVNGMTKVSCDVEVEMFNIGVVYKDNRTFYVPEGTSIIYGLHEIIGTDLCVDSDGITVTDVYIYASEELNVPLCISIDKQYVTHTESDVITIDLDKDLMVRDLLKQVLSACKPDGTFNIEITDVVFGKGKELHADNIRTDSYLIPDEEIGIGHRSIVPNCTCDECGRAAIGFNLDFGNDCYSLTCGRHSMTYFIEFSRYYSDPDEWVSHLSKKTWFEPHLFDMLLARLEEKEEAIRVILEQY